MATFGTSNKYIVYSLNSQELQIDIDNNRSLVRVWVDAWRTNTGYTTYGSGTVYCGINGTVYTAGITSSQKITSSAIRLGTWDVWIPHDGDGSKTIWVSARIDHSQFTASDQGYNHTLSTIPRASDASISYSGYIGDNLTVNISRKSSSFTHSVYHDFVAGTWTLVASNVDTSYTFQTPLEWLNRIPNSVGSAGRILVRTWNGGSIVGDKIYNFNANAKNTVVPTFTSVTASAVNPFGSLYLQGKSSIKLTINGASGVYGSTIKTYSISGGDYSYSGDKNTYTTGVVDKSGDITFTATITDSRGRTASKTVKVTVTAYTLPTLTFETYRCDSSGTKDIIKGTYIYVKPTFTYCVITGNAIKTKSIKINNTSKSTAFNSGQGYVFGTYPLRSTHEVEVSITDNVGNTVSVTHEIGIGKVIFNAPPHKNGVGWGRYCDKEGEFQIGYDLNVFGELMLNGVNLIDFIYPIGSQIYNSKKDFDPNKYYPGTTWVRIKGYVLAGINEGDGLPSHLTFDKTSGSKIGATHQDLRAWIGAYDANANNLGYRAEGKVSGENFTYGFNHGAAIASIGFDRINHTTMVSNISGQTQVSVIQPTQLTYIWERTA